MDTSTLIGFLAFGTIGAFAVFAYLSSVKTADRLHSTCQEIDAGGRCTQHAAARPAAGRHLIPV